MDRQQAADALQLLRKVVSQARDDTALENWGLVWMLNAVTNGGGFIATHFMLRDGIWSWLPYFALWMPILTFNAGTMLLKQRAGAKSFVEAQVWSIWNTFVVAMALLAVVNYLVGLDTLFMPPVAGILSAMAFSMMGALMGRWWYVPAAIWVVLTLVMALVPEAQFLLFGICWTLVQGSNGALLERARRRKLADPGRPRAV